MKRRMWHQISLSCHLEDTETSCRPSAVSIAESVADCVADWFAIRYTEQRPPAPPPPTPSNLRRLPLTPHRRTDLYPRTLSPSTHAREEIHVSLYVSIYDPILPLFLYIHLLVHAYVLSLSLFRTGTHTPCVTPSLRERSNPLRFARRYHRCEAR